MALYLGLDAGMQAVTAIVIEIEPAAHRILFEHRVDVDPNAAAPPLPWTQALERVMGTLAMAADVDVDNLRAISGSTHGALASVGRSLVSLLVGGPPPDDRSGVVGRLSSYWHRQYALPSCDVIAWSDETAAGLVGTGVVHPNTFWISLGTIDTVSSTTGSLQFYNGSLARQWMRLEHRLQWDTFDRLLEQTPGNDGYVLLPWLEPEITPNVAHAGIRRFGFDRLHAGKNVRGLVEGQMMAMANHGAEITGDSIDHIIATGSDATGHALLQVMANAFGADVYRLDTHHAAAIGAALRAYQVERLVAGEPINWPAVVKGFIEPHPGHRAAPNPKLVAMYAELRREYAILERLHRDRAPIC